MSNKSKAGPIFFVLLLLAAAGGGAFWYFRREQLKKDASQAAVDYTKAVFGNDKETLKRVATPELYEQVSLSSGFLGLAKALLGAPVAKVEKVAGVDILDDGSANVWLDVRMGDSLRRNGVVVIQDAQGQWRVSGKLGG